MKTSRIFALALALLLLACVVTANASDTSNYVVTATDTMVTAQAGDTTATGEPSQQVVNALGNMLFEAFSAEKAKRARAAATPQVKRARVSAARSKAMQTVEYAVSIQRGISGCSYDTNHDEVEESPKQDLKGTRYVVPVWVTGTIISLYFVEVWVSDDAEWVELKGCRKVAGQ